MIATSVKYHQRENPISIPDANAIFRENDESIFRSEANIILFDSLDHDFYASERCPNCQDNPRFIDLKHVEKERKHESACDENCLSEARIHRTK